MIYGAILEKGEQFYTYLSKIFKAIEEKQIDYNWLITDCDCYPLSAEIASLFAQEFCWLSGDELTSIIGKEDFQWVWGVLSGFEKGICLEDVLKYPFPYADGYPGFWKSPLSIQHPLASIEIVPFDSSFVLILSKRREIIDSFRKQLPLSEDLASFITRHTGN